MQRRLRPAFTEMRGRFGVEIVRTPLKKVHISNTAGHSWRTHSARQRCALSRRFHQKRTDGGLIESYASRHSLVKDRPWMFTPLQIQPRLVELRS